MQRPRSNQQDAMSGEFGMWDPSSITSKTSSQPQSAENNYGNLSRGSGSPANSSWHTASEPTTINTTGARSNMYMPEMSNTNSGYDQYPVAPYQSTYSNMQPSGQSSFSDIYYKPPSDLPANNHYYNNSGPTNTAGTMPQSSPSQAYNMNSGPVQNIAQPGGVRSRSDAPNWRSGDNAPEIQNIGSRLSSYAQNQRTYDPPPPRVASVDWQTFQNPLNQTDDDNDSAEQLISSMHKAAETAGAKLENTTRKPAAFSKATIAILEKDLKDAAAPFKSAETLKKFRDMHLGIDKSEVPGNVKVSETEQTADLPPLVAKSKLSVGAKEFIPRSMSPHTAFEQKCNEAGVESARDEYASFSKDNIPIVPKLDLPISPESDRAKCYPYGLSSTPMYSNKFHDSTYYAKLYGEDLNSSEVLLSDVIETPATNESVESEPPISQRSWCDGLLVFETDVCWNPLDGPLPVKKRKSKLSFASPQQLLKDREKIANCKNNFSVKLNIENGEFSVKNESLSSSGLLSVCEATTSTETVVCEKMALSLFPCFDDGSSNAVLPLLGLHSLDCLGFQSEKDSLLALAHKVKSMKDLSEEEKEKRAKHDSENETIAINLMDEFIDRLICNPASFDKIVPSTVEQLRSLDLPHSAISIIVDKIYEMCVVEQNFRYLGSQLCDTMSRYSTGLPKFRKTLLEKAKNEFEGMDEALLNGKEEDIKRARGFTQYMAEVFLSLMCEKSTGELERFAVLGRATFGVVRKLIDHPSDDNLQCAVRVLKLTIVSMEESLKDDEKNSMEKLKSILDDLSAFADNSKHPGLKLNELTKNLLDGFVKLRKENWGRVPPEESYPDQSTAQHYPPELLAERDANYYMNEPVFFTPNGVQYTAADAADPDFYNQHLAPYSVHYQPPAHDAARPNQTQPTEPAQFYKDNSSFTCNPMDAVDVPPTHTRMAYTNWSTGDADRYDYACAEDDYAEDVNQDDYDAEFENFMRDSGQI